MKKLIMSFILGGIIFGSVGIYAASYVSKDISYTPIDSDWKVSNVNEAIDSLYDMKIELDNIKDMGDATAEDILEGKTAVIKGELVTGSAISSVLSFIKLPASTYVDVTNYYDKYNELTADNFIVEYSFSATAYKDGNVMTYNASGTASIAPLKSYNANTGVLTISGLSSSITGIKHPNDPNKGLMTATASASIKSITLVVNK